MGELEILVDLRARERDEVQEELAQAVRAYRSADATVRELCEKRRRKERDRDETTARENQRMDERPDVRTARHLTDYRRAIDAELTQLRAEIQQAERERAELEREMESVRERLAEAEAALSAVEKVVESRADEAARKRSRKAQGELDEIAMGRWSKSHEDI